MWKRAFSCLLVLGSLSAPSAAYASAADQGMTSSVLTTTDGRAFFEQNGTRTARPACATATRWVIDTTTATGQAILANLITAHAQGTKVYVSGSGNCGLWGDSETAAGVMTAN
jgi:hypothetical protein